MTSENLQMAEKFQDEYRAKFAASSTPWWTSMISAMSVTQWIFFGITVLVVGWIWYASDPAFLRSSSPASPSPASPSPVSPSPAPDTTWSIPKFVAVTVGSSVVVFAMGWYVLVASKSTSRSSDPDAMESYLA